MTLQLRAWTAPLVAAITQAVAVSGARGPVIYADELGYVAAARYFGPGYPDVQMLSAFYHSGYGLLLAPLTVVFTEPDSFYRAATLFNGLMVVAATFLLEAVVFRRCLNIEGKWSTAAAVGFAVTPSLLFHSSLLWAEVALACFMVFTLAALLLFVEHPTTVRALAASSAATYCYALHPRGIAVPAALCLVVVVSGFQREVPRLGAGVVVVSSILGLIAVRLVNGLTRAALYTEGSTTQTAGSLFRDQILSEPAQWSAGLVGSLWYQLLATLSLGALGWLWWVRSLKEARTRRLGVAGHAGLFLLLVLGATWLAGATIAIADEPRIDQLFYGRYLDHLAPLAVAFGLLEWNARSRATHVVAIGSLVALPLVGLLLTVTRSSDFFLDRAVVRANVGVASALERVLGSWSPTLFGVLGATVAFLVLLGLSKWPPVGLAMLALVTCSATMVTLWHDVYPASRSSSTRSTLGPRTEELASGGSVLLAAPYDVWMLYGLQYWADDVQFELDTHCPTAAVDFVVAPAGDPRFETWTSVEEDAVRGRSLLRDGSGHSSKSKALSLAIDTAEQTSEGTIVFSLTLTNEDQERSLEVGLPPRLELFFLWFENATAEEWVAATPLGANLTLEPGQTQTIRIERPEPDLESGTYRVMVDGRLPGNRWLSHSPCAESAPAWTSLTLS